MNKTAFSILLCALAGVLSCACGLAHAAPASAPSRAKLSTALKTFLAQHGDVCLAKYNWPIDVSQRDFDAKTRDAVQLPVMEQQGLVKSSDGYVVYNTDSVVEKVPTKRYELTALGRRSYKIHEFETHPHPGQTVLHHADLCAGHLGLDTIVQMNAPAAANGSARTASVSYLYRFTAEAWVKNEQVLQVFPMLGTLIKGQGKMAMTQSFHFDGREWVADTEIN